MAYQSRMLMFFQERIVLFVAEFAAISSFMQTLSSECLFFTIGQAKHAAPSQSVFSVDLLVLLF
jgi:hypothetical protein